MRVCMYACVWMYMYVHVCIHTFVYICSICVCICICICVCMCVCTCMYVVLLAMYSIEHTYPASALRLKLLISNDHYFTLTLIQKKT